MLQPCQAQKSIAEQLEYIIYEDQDLTRGQQLYERITPEDIKAMPDSVLFNYHYLGGYINSEIPNHSKAIEHLLIAKKLCESNLGTHSIPYMEIMFGLGNEYIEIKEYDTALGIFQEGIIKSMAAREYAGIAFSNLIMGVTECYENLGYYNEITRHLRDAWSFWDKEEKPLVTYTYYPLWSLEQFYRRYEMFENALGINNEILEFIEEKAGESHLELADAFYMRGNILKDMNRKEDAIDAYRQGIHILKINKIKQNELLAMLQGNLMTTLASIGNVLECESILKDIKAYWERKGDLTNYKNALFTAAREFNSIGLYENALDFNKNLQKLNLTTAEIPVVQQQYEEIQFNKSVIDDFEDLLFQYSILKKGSSEWFENAHLVSSAYSIKHDLINNLTILEDMYSALEEYPEFGNNYTLWIMNNLMAVNSEMGNHEEAVKYAIIRKEYIDSLAEATEDIKIEALNQVIVMKIRGGFIDQIDNDWNLIGDYYPRTYGEVSEENATHLHNLGRTYQMQGKLELAKATLQKSINIQNELFGKPMGRTVKYLMEVENLLSDELI